MDNVVTIFVLPAVFGLAALAMAALSIISFRNTQRWRAEGVTVEGEVTGFVKRDLPSRDDIDERDDRVQKYSPILSFVAADGKSYQVTASACEPEGTYTLGQHLPVRYLPSSPEKADLEAMAVSNVSGIACAILSLVSGTVAYVVFNASR